MKFLLIDTTWPINSRTERFKNSFKKYFEVIVVAWNRGLAGGKEELEGTYILDTNIGYGNQLKIIKTSSFLFIFIQFVRKKNQMFCKSLGLINLCRAIKAHLELESKDNL